MGIFDKLFPPRPRDPILDQLLNEARFVRQNTALMANHLATVVTSLATQNETLDQIERHLRPAPATHLLGSASGVRKGSALPKGADMDVQKLDYKSDLEDALLKVSPNGPVDADVEWAGNFEGVDAAGDPTSTPVEDALEVEEVDGAKRAILRLPTDAATFKATIVATAKVDNPNTPDIVEAIQQVFILGGAHSKASDLAGGIGTVAKGAGFPS